MVEYDGIWQLVAFFGSMWLYMHLNGFIRFKCSNIISFGFLQLRIVELHVVTYGFKWIHMVACHICACHIIFLTICPIVICLFFVVVCGSIWFHKVVYSQIWFHLVPTVAYCGLELHVVANGFRLFMLYMYMLCVSLLYFMDQYGSILLNIVANSQCRRSVHRRVLHICVLLMWIHMIASRQYNAIVNLVCARNNP